METLQYFNEHFNDFFLKAENNNRWIPEIEIQKHYASYCKKFLSSYDLHRYLKKWALENCLFLGEVSKYYNSSDTKERIRMNHYLWM